MTKFRFSRGSKRNLVRVHPDLVGLCYAVLYDSPYDFGITDGVRTLTEQKSLLAAGKTTTMNSRHLLVRSNLMLPEPGLYLGHAIDFAIWLHDEWNWEFEYYRAVADVFKKLSFEYGIPIVWGGDWTSFRDGPHIELDRQKYPVNT